MALAASKQYGQRSELPHKQGPTLMEIDHGHEEEISEQEDREEAQQEDRKEERSKEARARVVFQSCSQAVLTKALSSEILAAIASLPAGRSAPASDGDGRPDQRMRLVEAVAADGSHLLSKKGRAKKKVRARARAALIEEKKLRISLLIEGMRDRNAQLEAGIIAEAR